jgi:hypothetical protein
MNANMNMDINSTVIGFLFGVLVVKLYNMGTEKEGYIGCAC